MRGRFLQIPGIVVLGCVAYMLLFTAALIVVGPWLDRRRLARAQQYTQPQGVTARFESLCDQAGLTGAAAASACGGRGAGGVYDRSSGGRPLVVLPLKATLGSQPP